MKKNYISPDLTFLKVSISEDVLTASSTNENAYVDIGDLGGGGGRTPGGSGTNGLNGYSLSINGISTPFNDETF